jgi:hypothetical protein
MEDWPRTILETATQHLPPSAAWLPYATIGLLALLGLVLLLKGGRLAPFMIALGFLCCGSMVGWLVGPRFGVGEWPALAIGAVVGFGIGLALFKIWLALLTATGFVAGALILYGVNVLAPFLQAYTIQGYNAGEAAVGITLPTAGPTEATSAPHGELSQLWSYLSANVPTFQPSFWAIVGSTGLAGLLVGLLLPRVSRALLAAAGGVGCSLLALVVGLKALWPEALAWLESLGAWTWAIVAAVFVLALLRNFFDLRRVPARSPARAQSSAANAAPAPA